MTREAFMSWLESQLQQRGVQVGRWLVEPALQDLEIQGGDGAAVRL